MRAAVPALARRGGNAHAALARPTFPVAMLTLALLRLMHAAAASADCHLEPHALDAVHFSALRAHPHSLVHICIFGRSACSQSKHKPYSFPNVKRKKLALQRSAASLQCLRSHGEMVRNSCVSRITTGCSTENMPKGMRKANTNLVHFPM